MAECILPLFLHPNPIHLEPCTVKLHMAASGPCLKETGPKGGVLLALLRAENVQDGEARPLQVMTKSDNTFGTEESGDGEEDAGGTSVDNILDLKIKTTPPGPKSGLLLKKG